MQHSFDLVLATESIPSEDTIAGYLVALRSFYQRAETGGLLTKKIVDQMTYLKYFPAGSPAGGEYGNFRRVLVPELQVARHDIDCPPEWIDSAQARRQLEDLRLRSRDRFLVDRA